MSALEIAVGRLKALPTITALTTAARIYAIGAPQDVPPPYILVNLVSEPDEQMLSGAGGYYESRVSVECIAPSALVANNMGEAAKGMDLVKGTVGSQQGVDIYKADSDYSDRSDDRQTFRRVMDFYIRWR